MSGDLVRVSDADREHAVASRREHLVQGRMTSAYDAKTSNDLAELQRDLPMTAPEPRRSALRHLVAIFGAAKRTGALRVQQHLVCVAIFGSVTLDLRGASGARK